jgi:hypothetical protein
LIKEDGIFHPVQIVKAKLTGAGVINGAQGLTHFNGTLSPGNSPALTSIAGNATLASNTKTELEISGTGRGSQYDAIDIGQTIQLAGSLSITFTDGYKPSAGDSFLLVQAASIQGSFDSIDVPSVDGLNLTVETTEKTVILQAQDSSSDGTGSQGASSGGAGSSGGGAVAWTWLLLMLGLLMEFRSGLIANRKPRRFGIVHKS